MKWLLIFGLIALLNAPTILADSDEDSSGSSSDSNSSSDSSSSSSSPEHGPKKPHSPPKSKTVITSPKSSPKKPHSPPKSKTVKITEVSLLKYCDNYFSSDSKFEIKQVNSTYNAVCANYGVKKDLPSDTKVVIQVYGSSSESGTYSSIHTCSLTLNDTTNKYYKYLPAGLIKDTKCSKSLKKGTYTSDDYGFVQFHKILTKEQLKYSYYKVVFNLECENEVLVSLDERFQYHS